MILKKLNLNNIRSYKDLEISFLEGTTLLSGDIGAGKTSILLGLQFALFGLQPGQKGSSILRHGEDSAEVSIIFEVDKKEIKIERKLKKAKSGSITQDFNAITIEGKREEISTSELKNKIIKLLDYPKEFVKKSDLLYKFTVYTPQEGMKEIINERPEIRLDIIRHIFGIDRYKRIKENAQRFIQKIKENVKIKEVQVSELNSLKEKLVLTSEDKIKNSKEVNNLSLDLQKINERKKDFSERLEKLRISLEEKNKLDVLMVRKEGEIYSKNQLISRLEKEINANKSQIAEKIEFSLESLENNKNLLIKHKKLVEDLSSKLMDLNSKIYSLNSEKEKSVSMKEKVVSLENCPTCFQTVSGEYKEKISKKTQFDIEDADRELSQKNLEKEKVVEDLEKEKNLILEYESEVLNLEKNKLKYENQKTVETKIKSDSIILDRSLQEKEILEKELLEIKISSEKFSSAKESFEIEKKNLDNVDFESRRIEIGLAEKRKELELLTNRLEELNEAISGKEKTKLELAHIRGLQDWLTEKFLPLITITETNVLATLRRDFSKIFHDWFSVLVSEALSARLDEDFTPIISNQDYEIDYEFLSGGERTAVALAYRLALNQTINTLVSRIKTKDVLILDEPTDGFSEQQLDKVRDILDQLDCSQIILVSHEQKIEGFVDNIIRIKKDGTSSIESHQTSHPQ